jgi:NADH-quinone oxidoreductase subunit G
MAVVIVNGNSVDIGNDRLNLIQAAERGGVFVPHYCWHPALTVVASCRMCLVEVGDKKPDGTVAMQPKVVPACQTPAKDGSVIVTNSPKAKAAQQQTLEGILLNHPLDCPVCDKAGECLLQDFSYRFGNSTSRMIDEKNQPPNKPHIGEHITLFADRCIMCSRCVRFSREVSGKGELEIINRGNHSEIDIFPGEPVNNKLAGNVVDLCPVGALCSKDFLYTQRVWFLKETKSVCPDCSTGCSIEVGHNKDVVFRLRPRENPKAQGYFMCDDGRFDYPYINSRDRISEPLWRNAGVTAFGWENVLPVLRKELSEAAARDGAAVIFVLSPFFTCEEAFLLGKFAKGLSPRVRLALGPIPLIGLDDTYPKDRRGNATTTVKFTIRAEKCPNRRGVEEVLKHLQGEVIAFETVVEAAGRGEIQAAYLTAGYPPRAERWYTPEQAAALQRVPLLVVQDLFASPLTGAARFVLPASSFAEKDGTFVNHGNLAQEIHWAVRPTSHTKTDGQIILDLLQRRGLIHAPTIRKELAAEVPFFAPLAEELGEQGVVLGEHELSHDSGLSTH